MTSICEFCGATPAREFEFYRNVGKLIFRTKYSLEKTLCKNCALAIGREFQSRTLLQGWWGAISVFVNSFDVVFNSIQLLRANRMPESNNGISGMSAGPSVLRRGKSIVGLIAIISLITFGVNRAIQPDPLPLEVGSCLLNLSKDVEIVPCSDPHDGVVIQEVTNDWNCPRESDGTFELKAGGFICVDEVSAGSN